MKGLVDCSFNNKNSSPWVALTNWKFLYSSPGEFSFFYLFFLFSQQRWYTPKSTQNDYSCTKKQ